MYCDCGSKMYVYTETPVYKCKACKRKIDVADIDEIFHEQLRSFLLTDADIESISDSNDSMLETKETLYNAVSNEYQTLKKKIADLVNIRLSGELQKDDFAALYKPIEEQVRQHEKQLPEMEAEIDFLKIQNISTDTIIQEAKDLYNRWPELPFNEKRSIIEIITEKIVIHQDSIDIALSYLPTLILSTMTEKVNATSRIQCVTDAVNQGYIEFNPSGATNGIAIGNANTEFFRILNSGNVGIGTTTPLTTLHVDGAATACYYSLNEQSINL